jgi:hypothetical protein
MPDTSTSFTGKNLFVELKDPENLHSPHRVPAILRSTNNKSFQNNVENRDGNGKPVRKDNWTRFFGNS